MADIWSFACVISECCTWVTFGKHGEHGLDGYRKRRLDRNVRQRGDCFHEHGAMSPVVSREHERVASECDPVTRKILQILPQMMAPDPNARPYASDLRREFKDIMDGVKVSTPRSSPIAAPGSSTDSNPRTNSGPNRPLGRRLNPSYSTTGALHHNLPQEPGAQMIDDALMTTSPRGTIIGNYQVHPNTLTAVSYEPRPRDTLPMAGPSRTRPSVREADCLPSRSTLGPTSNNSSDHQRSQTVALPIRGNGKEPAYLADDEMDRRPMSAPVMPPPGSVSPSREVEAIPPQESLTTNDIRTAAVKQSVPIPEPPAYLSFEAAFNWRAEMRTKRSSLKLADHSLLEELKGRDHVRTSIA